MWQINNEPMQILQCIIGCLHTTREGPTSMQQFRHSYHVIVIKQLRGFNVADSAFYDRNVLIAPACRPPLHTTKQEVVPASNINQSRKSSLPLAEDGFSN